MKYKVGDKVKIINSVFFPIGEIVRVRSTDLRGNISSCEYLDGSDYWYVDEDDVELVSFIKGGSMIKKYGLKYDREIDPVELFDTKKEREARLEGLLKDPSTSNWYLFETTSWQRVEQEKNYKLVSVK